MFYIKSENELKGIIKATEEAQQVSFGNDKFEVQGLALIFADAAQRRDFIVGYTLEDLLTSNNGVLDLSDKQARLERTVSQSKPEPAQYS